MPAETRCPQCNQSLTQVGKHWVCPEHGLISLKKPSAALRIFLSYGHDSNEELVRQIKADLEKRRHDVWFDKNEIKAGDNWRRSITDGILQSDRVLSFLSKHSTRDPGVCRDEIAIAIGVKGGNIQTILVESEQEVQAPVNIGHIQWLGMHPSDYLLANPLRSVIHGGRERYLIVIDALDEAGEAGRNPLVEMLARNAQRLPDWLGLVVSSRPKSAVTTLLRGPKPFAYDIPTKRLQQVQTWKTGIGL